MASSDDPFGRPTADELLSLEEVSPGKVDVYFLPLSRFLVSGEEEAEEGTRVRLLHVDVLDGLLTTFPMKNLFQPFKMPGAKYGSIERISFSGGVVVYTPGTPANGENGPEPKFLGSYVGDTVPPSHKIELPQPKLEDTIPKSADDVRDILDGLPPYCGRQPQYGLGFKQPYRAVVYAIQDLTEATEIRISQRPTAYHESSRTFVLSASDMLDLRASIDRVNRITRTAANTVNATSTYNEIADVLGLPKRVMRYGRTEYRKALTAVGNDERPLSRAEQVELLTTFTKNASSILKREPATMDGLESGIAIARTQDLLENLRKMMGESHDENDWQRFLQENPFVLSMLFGRPIVRLADQASVGGRKVTGGGDKITDFLVRNALTDNAALVEIKTPKVQLLNTGTYRKAVYIPSRELVGAISQALDQKDRFEKNIARIRDQNRDLDVEAYHVQACVLAGTMPSGHDRVRFFELFRQNLKDVVVMTFDELLRKVEDLCEFLRAGNGPKDDDIPF